VTEVVIDFTSASYLGLRHASESLRPWAQLTSGVPAALAEPRAARHLSGRLARLTGTDQAVLATSTLHAFWDLFVVRACLANRSGEPGIALYLDAASYPISRWGVERATGHGVPALTVPHHDPEALRRILASRRTRGLRPVLVADGFCPGCGRAAPLAEFLRVIRDAGGELVLDDTQPLGLLGSPQQGSSYGVGGGGSLRHARVSGPDLILVSSLAKAFGVPVAMVTGSAGFIRGYLALSQTRVHCSPPSSAHLSAGAHALMVNQCSGERLRARLADLVDRFQYGLGQAGLPVPRGTFPVQSLRFPSPLDPVLVHRELLGLGIRAVLHRSSCLGGVAVSFLITARHSAANVDAAISALVRAANASQPARTRWAVAASRPPAARRLADRSWPASIGPPAGAGHLTRAGTRAP
jgi:8-amino-7-oxononanoate synthase